MQRQVLWQLTHTLRMSSNSLTRFSLGAALLCAAASVGAVPVLDQVQSQRAALIAEFRQGGLAQSFIQASDNIVGAGIWLFTQNPNAGGVIIIDLYDALPTTAGANLLATGRATGQAGDFVEVSFDKGSVDLIDDHTYFLVFTSLNPNLLIAGSTENPYPRGQVYANDFSPFPAFDYAFATFAEARVAVPEPGSLALLVIALAGGAFARRSPKH